MRLFKAGATLFAALATSAWAALNDSTTFPSSLERVETKNGACPVQCSAVGVTDGSWSPVRSLDALDRCAQPVLFDTSIRTPIDSHTYIRACTLSSDYGQLMHDSSTQSCLPGSNQTDGGNQTMSLSSPNATVQLGWVQGSTDATAQLSDLVDVAKDLQSSAPRHAGCGETILFVKYRQAVMGLYVGAEIDRVSVSPIIQQLIKFMNGLDSGSVPSGMMVQLCEADKSTSRTDIMGAAASANGDIHAVQQALLQWADAKCLTGFNGAQFDGTRSISGQQVTKLSAPAVTSQRMGTSGRQSTSSEKTFLAEIGAEDVCKYVMVESGNTCDTLAERCDISTDDLIKYNGDGDDAWCDTLLPDEPVCCSEGDPPDLRPQPNDDGSCAVYTIGADDYCQKIVKQYHLEDNDLENFNVGKTWAWQGCERLLPDQKICISDGNPPMPNSVENAVCGPQKPGTKAPTDGTSLSDLNPCPLNVCCDVWGQCGSDETFCTDTSINDTPGTAANGTNGCVSNCGLDIVNNDEAPAQFERVTYFEAWNRDRPCLHMDVTDIGDPFTIVHFAFGEITTDFQVSAGSAQSEFASFLGMSDAKFKKIISFGGWAFSNDANTSMIMRNGVKPENRDAFASNVVKFVQDNGLDGVDFDWEYPGADDIPGSTPGTPDDGPNYLEFLKLVRAGLGDDPILAIAAPSSYWYLRNFPISDISDVVSYIVYMSYDLHGQWDVDNKFVSPGCPEGNCLRSQINSTETHNALAMVTKAGVKANKLMIGITSYGRSFKMTEAGCTGPMCHYEGGRNQSPAEPGKCTETGGYIAQSEIDEIIANGGDSVQTWHDDDSDSDMMVYDDVQWVGYMTNETKEARVSQYAGLNFGGASDWAVDLQGATNSDNESETVYIGPEVYQDGWDQGMHCEAPCTLVLAPSQLSSTTTISIPPYTSSIEAGEETVTITVSPPAITTTEIQFFNVPVSSMGDNTTSIQPYPSLTLKPQIVTYTYTRGEVTSTSSRNITLPPWPLITSGLPPDGSSWSSPPPISTGSGSPPSSGEVTGPPPPPITTPTPTFSGYAQVQGTVTPVKDKPVEPVVEADDDDTPFFVKLTLPCDEWFFSSCDEDTGGFAWKLPVGIMPPGPPPPAMLDFPGLTMQGGTLPPMPPMTIPTPGGPPPSFPDKPDPCEPAVASFCGTTTSFGTTGTVTTTTSSWSTCRTITGCHVEDWETSTTTGDCTLPTKRALPTRTGSIPAHVDAVPTGVAEMVVPLETAAPLEARAGSCDTVRRAIILPQNTRNVDSILLKLKEWCNHAETPLDPANVYQVKALDFDATQAFTPWFVVAEMPLNFMSFRHSSLTGNGIAIIADSSKPGATFAENPFNEVPGEPLAADVVDTDTKRDTGTTLLKRADTVKRTTSWATTLLSAPRALSKLWSVPTFLWDGSSDATRFSTDSGGGQGQTIYVVDDGFDFDHARMASAQVRANAPGRQLTFPADLYDVQKPPTGHGTMVASQIWDEQIGAAPGADFVPVPLGDIGVKGQGDTPFRIMHGLLLALDDIVRNKRASTSVVNLSAGFWKDHAVPRVNQIAEEILAKFLDNNIVMTVAAGNGEAAENAGLLVIQDYLYRHKSQAVIAGMVDKCGVLPPNNKWSRFPNAPGGGDMEYGGGIDVRVADPGDQNGYTLSTGTSFVAPRHAATIAVWRSMGDIGEWQDKLATPAGVVQVFGDLKGTLSPTDGGCSSNPARSMKHAWNGWVPADESGTKAESCLRDGDLKFDRKDGDGLVHVCPCSWQTNEGIESVGGVSAQASCSNPGNGGGGDGNGGGGTIGDLPLPKPIDFAPGPPSPTCTAHCGVSCGDDDYYCTPQPTGTPPDQGDPDNGDGDWRWKLQWYKGDQCQEDTIGDDTTGDERSEGCNHLADMGYPSSVVVTNTIDQYIVCLYAQDDCKSSGTGDLIQLEGKTDGECSVPPNGQSWGSWRVTMDGTCVLGDGGGDDDDPPPPTYDHPDPMTNAVSCFDSGAMSGYSPMYQAVYDWCVKLGSTAPSTMPEKHNYETTIHNDTFGVDLDYVMQLYVKEGCEWEYNANDCAKYYKTMMDGCDCDTMDFKQGGTMENNCLSFRLDPNTFT